MSTLDGCAALSWLITSSIRAGAQLQATRTRRDDGGSERSLTSNLQTHWDWGGLEVQTAYVFRWRDVPSTQTMGRWSLRATRRF